MKLYFLRHGVAGNRREWQGDDFDRPLTTAGKARMRREAASIRRLGLGLDAIVSSPLVRALQTAEIVADDLQLRAKLAVDERLAPGFSPELLTGILQAHKKANALMLVGHEPDFSETIRQLIGGGRVVVKKGALACVELDDLASLHGELVWLIPPKMLAQ